MSAPKMDNAVTDLGYSGEGIAVNPNPLVSSRKLSAFFNRSSRQI